jgi:hypothetical protein
MKIKSPTLILSAIAIASLGIGGVAAQATTITGTVSFSGTATMNTASFLTATKFVSFQDVFVGAPSSLFGDYTTTSGAAVTMTPFTWNPVGASTPLSPLWTFLSGGKTYSFDLSVLHEDFASSTGLLLSGLGTAHITGETDTSGLWNFSSQTFGESTFTFSSTTQVPPPSPSSSVSDGGSTAMLLGAAFCGLALVQKKLKKV